MAAHLGDPCPSCRKGKTIPCLQCDGHHVRPRAAGDRESRQGTGYFYDTCPTKNTCVCDPKTAIYNHGPQGCEGNLPEMAAMTGRIPNKLPVSIRNMKSQAIFKGYGTGRATITKRHFEAAAKQLGASYKAASNDDERAGVHAAANHMADFFYEHNSAFDHNRFHTVWKEHAGLQEPSFPRPWSPARRSSTRRRVTSPPQRARIVNSAWNNAPEDTRIPDKLPENFGKSKAPHPHSLQGMINSGSIWHMEGSAGRGAMAAIESGEACLGHRAHADYWGNRVPSRHEVEPGTKGSPEYMIDRGGEPDECDETCPTNVRPKKARVAKDPNAIPDKLPASIRRMKKSGLLFKMRYMGMTPRCDDCGHLQGDHYTTGDDRGGCSECPEDSQHRFRLHSAISGNAREVVRPEHAEVPHQLPEEIRNMKSQVIFKGRPNPDDDEVGGCCEHPKGAHNSYGCANCAAESPKRGRQDLYEGVINPSRYGGKAGHDFEGHAISGNAGEARSPVGWSHPSADPNRAPRAFTAQRHQILFDLHDKFHGTGKEKPFYGPEAEPTEKSQRVYDPRPRKLLPKMSLGGRDANGGSAGPRASVRTQAAKPDRMRDLGNKTDRGDLSYAPKVRKSAKRWR